MVDLIDHGIIDLDIMNGKMMGEYVAVLMINLMIRPMVIF